MKMSRISRHMRLTTSMKRCHRQRGAGRAPELSLPRNHYEQSGRSQAELLHSRKSMSRHRHIALPMSLNYFIYYATPHTFARCSTPFDISTRWWLSYPTFNISISDCTTATSWSLTYDTISIVYFMLYITFTKLESCIETSSLPISCTIIVHAKVD